MIALAQRRIALLGQQAIQWLLRATFGTDQAAPLPASLPVDVGGPLTVVDTGSVLSISGGKLQHSAVPTGATGVSDVLRTRTVGLALFCAISRSAPAEPAFGWKASAAQGSDYTANVYGWKCAFGTLRVAGTSVSYSGDTGAETLRGIIQRSSGAFFVTALGGGRYRLEWVANESSVDLAAQYQHGGQTGLTTLDNFRVLDLARVDARFATDFGLALNRSTFTAADGTALTAITPEAGGVWTAQAGVIEVQSNKAKALTLSGGTAVATVQSGSADVVTEATVNPGSPSANAIYLVFRYTNATNFWFIYFTSGHFSIYEKNAGVNTARADIALSPVANTDYRIVVVCEGTTITAYINNANKITYASATLNQTVTVHGILFDSVGWTIDDYVVYPRTLTLPVGI